MADSNFTVGQTYTATVTHPTTFAYFVDLPGGTPALLHLSNVPADTSLETGQVIQVKVVSIDSQERIAVAIA